MTAPAPSTSGAPTTARKTKIAWLDSKHSFSFGSHYDPDNTHHGLLLVNNDDIVKPGTGFRYPPAPRHGDRHLGAARLAGPPGLHRPLRRDLSRAGPADVGGPRHPALGEERLVDADRRAVPQRASAFRADVGGARRVRHHPRLPAARDRRRAAARRAGDDRLRHARAQRRRGDHASATSTPPCTAPACSPATASSCPQAPVPAPVRPPRRGRRSKAPARCTRATPCGSPRSGGQRVTATEPAEILVWEMHAGLAAA